MKDDEILLKIYTELYKVANPPHDFNEIVKLAKAEKLENNWFEKYTLSMAKQDEIIERVLNECKVKKWKKEAFKITVTLGCSPNYENSDYRL